MDIINYLNALSNAHVKNGFKFVTYY
jgi:hypothetical protein